MTGAGLAGWWPAPAASATTSVSLTLATWNLQWLMTPATRQQLQGRCLAQQPDSDTRALPCTPGRPPVPVRQAGDLNALAQVAQSLRDTHGVSLVGLQEVDGPEAARQLFGDGWRVACFTGRAHPQDVGFALRAGLPFKCNPPLMALDVDGATRAGADITLWPDTPQAVRVLNVHLKSGCFTGRLDRSFGPCETLRAQAPVIEAWIDARVREGAAFAVMGDFNRHLETDARHLAGHDESAPLNLVQAWSDDQPRGATLWRATDGQAYVPCHARERHRHYIDDILIGQSLALRYGQRRFTRLPFDDFPSERVLSDHCPVVWTLSRGP